MSTRRLERRWCAPIDTVGGQVDGRPLTIPRATAAVRRRRPRRSWRPSRRRANGVAQCEHDDRCECCSSLSPPCWPSAPLSSSSPRHSPRATRDGCSGWCGSRPRTDARWARARSGTWRPSPRGARSCSRPDDAIVVGSDLLRCRAATTRAARSTRRVSASRPTPCSTPATRSRSSTSPPCTPPVHRPRSRRAAPRGVRRPSPPPRPSRRPRRGPHVGRRRARRRRARRHDRHTPDAERNVLIATAA